MKAVSSILKAIELISKVGVIVMAIFKGIEVIKKELEEAGVLDVPKPEPVQPVNEQDHGQE